MTGTVLILGASGRFGRNAAEALWNAGWQVRRFDRKTQDLDTAARGADLIVNGWNPAYSDWATMLPELTAKVIAAARKSGATVIIPGNVYGFGENAPARFAADTPLMAQNPLGRLRIEMETAYRNSGVRTIVLRAGDFIDTEASGNWFDRIMTSSLPKGRFTYPGQADIPHAWAYLPDMARATVQLAELRDQLGRFEDIPFPGYTMTGHDIAQHLSNVLQRSVRVKQMSWIPLKLLQPVWPEARKLLEMRYLWNKPHWLDGARFEQLVPDFKPTLPEVALASAVQINVDPDKVVTGGALTRDQVA